VPVEGKPLRRLGFLSIGIFDGDDPAPGHESLLRILELGEQLGYDHAWLRHRHLQYGVSSPVAIMAAASQRTSRIELGTAVTPLGWENPLRLAEDLATVDILSRGRVNPGISTGPPMRWDDVKHALYPDTAEHEDLTYERARRFLSLVAGDTIGDVGGMIGFEAFSDRVQPYSPGLRNRVWYGGGSLRSARWAGENSVHFLSSNVIRAEESEVFDDIQETQIRLYRSTHPDGARARASQGLVVIPTDSATPEQRAKYHAYVDKRTPRTATPQGPQRMLFAADVIGSSQQIAEQLYASKGFRQVDEVAFALPFSFEHEDYVQILTDIATKLGPALGWQPGPGSL
jgi:alkanesulfonate monooxygenase SsuD/methylene tetrahydromethanopterin reductase-like flavin-dependent oxidoreductase (luciferase family)